MAQIETAATLVIAFSLSTPIDSTLYLEMTYKDTRQSFSKDLGKEELSIV